MQGYGIFSHHSSTGIGSQCLSSELPPDKLLFSWLERPAGLIGFSTEVSCSTSQFLLVAQGSALRICDLQDFKVPFDVKMLEWAGIHWRG